ncbi:MAG: hypothetical protein OXH22_05185 [Chloroflexi bacterium]|nr:hypothetical protein [Chloroflexota bacterium]
MPRQLPFDEGSIRFYRNEINPHIAYITSDDVTVYTTEGDKPESDYDFKVKYRQPGKRPRTPKHIHIIIDLYQKRDAEPNLTNAFVDHIINNIIEPAVAITSYPPDLQIFRTTHISEFEGLSGVGEYSVEFLLVIIELIMIQERTNYPEGTMNLDLFRKFRNNEDIFSVVSAATFRGR